MLRTLVKTLRSRTPEVAGLLLLMSVAATVLCATEYRQQSDAVQHTLRVKNSLGGLLSTLQDAETGQRGYLLSADASFLEPYTLGTRLSAEELATVKRLTSDNPAQQSLVEKLAPVVERKLAELADRIERFRSGSLPTLEQLQSGKADMDQIRATVAMMSTAEDALLQKRSAGAQRFILFAMSFALLTAALAIAAVGGWVWQSRLLTTDLKQANEDLRATVAQRDLAESKARQMQKLEAIGQLTGGVAHDFNNILAVIMSGLSLLQRRAKSLEEAKPFVTGALDAAKRGADLTRRLLAFARQQPLDPRTIDVNRWISEVSDLIGRAVGETILTETVLGAGVWPLNVDPNELQNAVLNIAINARDAMPDGGKLTIETANYYFDARYSRENDAIAEGQYVLIAVTDTGMGMLNEVMEKAFEPFFTTKDTGKGTGLGLSQVHGFVKQSGGHVKIYSEIGKGTTVKLYFPRSEVPAEQERKRDTVEALPKGDPSRLVLVVEDDPRVRAVSVALMRELGYSVIHADGPTTALMKIQSHPGIELLFTDVVMPVMSGRQLATRALELRPELKVLYTTGFTKNAVVHGGVLDRGVHLLSKPYTIEDLARKLLVVLGN